MRSWAVRIGELSKEGGNYSSKINVVIAEEGEDRRSRRRGTRLGYRRQVEVVVPRHGGGDSKVLLVDLKVVASCSSLALHCSFVYRYVIRAILT